MSQRHAIFVPVGIAERCNQVAVFVGIDEAALLNTLSVPCVPVDGPDNAAATHLACCGQLTEEQRGYLENNKGAWPGAMWWRFTGSGLFLGRLAASYDGQSIGELWDWSKSLAAAGLKLQNLST